MSLKFEYVNQSSVKEIFGDNELNDFVCAKLKENKIRKVTIIRHPDAINWFAEDFHYAFFRDGKLLGDFEIDGEFHGAGNVKIGSYKIPRDCVLVEYGISFGKFAVGINTFCWDKLVS